MGASTCERCGEPVGSSSLRCGGCGAELGYDSDTGSVRELLATAVPSAYTLRDSGRLHWRCLASTSGCNGILFAHTAAVWCPACAPSRTR